MYLAAGQQRADSFPPCKLATRYSTDFPQSRHAGVSDGFGSDRGAGFFFIRKRK